MSRPRTQRRALAAVAMSVILVGCGGSSDEARTPPTRPQASLLLTQTFPFEHAGRLSVDAGTIVRTDHRPPDGISAEPYCLVRYRNLVHTSGGHYDMAVAFVADDLRVLVVTLNQRSTSWYVASFNPPAAEVTVSMASRTVRFHRNRSTQGGQVDWQSSVDGAVGVPMAETPSLC